MNLGFKDQFVPYVEDGSKTHSIRAGERWKVGMRADLYARPRQKGMRLLFRAPVIRVEPIVIEHRPRKAWNDDWDIWGSTFIRIADVELQPCSDEADLFAWRDGFRAEDDPRNSVMAFVRMVEFWQKEHGFGRKTHRFEGQVIHWDYVERFTSISETCYYLTRAQAKRWVA